MSLRVLHNLVCGTFCSLESSSQLQHSIGEYEAPYFARLLIRVLKQFSYQEVIYKVTALSTLKMRKERREVWSHHLTTTSSLLSSQVLNVVISVAFLLFPESKVLLEKLNDGLGVTEGLLIDVVNFVHGVLESGLSQLACLFVVLHHLIVEDREVEGESQLDGVACM